MKQQNLVMNRPPSHIILLTYHDPIPPIPRVFKMLTSIWKKNTKKKTMKLTELSSLKKI